MGGGAVRNAAKAAALGGYRSVRNSAAWRAPKPASVNVSAASAVAEGSPSVSIATSEKHIQESAPVPATQRPAWEIDDWEFASWAEEGQEVALDSLNPAPRLVFGPAPTLEEAKEAASDLKDALEKVYFSPSTNESSIEVPHESTHREVSAIIPSMPRHVVQAFSLLQGSTEAQEVVASLAADKNVWNAVMHNPKVMEFYKTHQSIAFHPESDVTAEVPVADNDGESSTAETTTDTVFTDFLHNVKVRVEEMVSNISSFFQEMFGTSSATSSSTSTTARNADKPFVDFAMGASFMALAVATILVVLLKRG